MRKQSLLRAAAAAFVVVTSACTFTPTNPFDPETPAAQQEPGHIIGRVFLDGHDFETKAVELRLLDSAGNPVSKAGEPVVVSTRVAADGFPKGFVDDELGPAGTFDVE